MADYFQEEKSMDIDALKTRYGSKARILATTARGEKDYFRRTFLEAESNLAFLRLKRISGDEEVLITESDLPMACAKVMQVIATLSWRGSDKEGDPIRCVQQYWSFDGRLLAEHDMQHDDDMPVALVDRPCL